MFIRSIILNPFDDYAFLLKFDLTFEGANCIIECIILCRTEENGRWKKRFTSGENGQLRAFYLFYCFTKCWLRYFHGLIKSYLLLKSAEKSLIFRFQCNDKIRLFFSPELYYITLLCLWRKISESLSAILFTETN